MISFWDFEVWEQPRFVVEATREARSALLFGHQVPPNNPFSRIKRGL